MNHYLFNGMMLQLCNSSYCPSALSWLDAGPARRQPYFKKEPAPFGRTQDTLGRRYASKTLSEAGPASSPVILRADVNRAQVAGA